MCPENMKKNNDRLESFVSSADSAEFINTPPAKHPS